MPQKNTTNATCPSVGKNVLTFLAILGIVLIIWLIVRLQSLAILVLMSVVFTTGLAPAVVWLEKHKLPKTAAIMVVFMGAVTVLLLALTLIVVPVVQAGIEFSKHLPNYLNSLENWLAKIHHNYPKVPDYAGMVGQAQSQLGNAAKLLTGSASAVFGFFGGIVSVLTVTVITIYSLATYDKIRDGFLSFIPTYCRKQAADTMSKMAAAMGGWLRGMLLLSAIIGLLSTTAMLILGVPYAPVIGIVGAVGELIPMVGPFAAAIPALLLTAFAPPLWKLIACLVFFAILAMVEGNVLAPRIMSKQVGLSPLVTILSLLAGGALLGLVGALLAIPIAAALQVLFVEVIGPAIKNWGDRQSGDV